jgi:hypothetical protein
MNFDISMKALIFKKQGHQKTGRNRNEASIVQPPLDINRTSSPTKCGHQKRIKHFSSMITKMLDCQNILLGYSSGIQPGVGEDILGST